ncbi:MAG: thioredoxin domain-containing protein, partial [Planctomycetes bacterium]|nr:thioredoxin domain-containing protein [Planctomycetota bacterium]
ERESFESEEIAAVMNEHFVSIKVDREERPDVDAIYMAAVTALSGQGGWPLTVFLAPDRRPIWGTTYLPPESRGGRPGLKEVLLQVAGAWRDDREALLGHADELVEAVRRRSSFGSGGPADVGVETLDELYLQLEGSFDAANGGFGGAPKFPRPHEIVSLVHYWARTGKAKALEMAEFTLDRMAAGGVRDHLGGGFHRYSTDDLWLVPHFEKMLYDQALLVWAYVEAYRATGHERHLDVARDTIDYVLRDLADPAGGFHSAEDADSEGAEGKFYVWREDEVAALLSAEELALARPYFGIRAQGNFGESFRHEGGIPEKTNILHAAKPLEEVAASLGIEPSEARQRLASAREKLLTARSGRIRPHKDDKVLVDWNGLMISALALVCQATGDERYAEAAARAASFVLARMRENGRLLHRYRDERAGVRGYLEDHAYLALGLLDLYEATFEPRWLKEAIALAGEMERLFRDVQGGGYLLAGSDSEELVASTKEIYDGATPSGNSVAALVLGRLARMTASPELEKRFSEQIRAFGANLKRQPIAYPYFLLGADLSIGPSREVVLAGPRDDPGLAAMKRAIQTRLVPNLVLLHHPPGDDGKAIEELAPFLAGQGLVDGKAAAYVCQNFACLEPVTEVDALLALLAPRGRPGE